MQISPAPPPPSSPIRYGTKKRPPIGRGRPKPLVWREGERKREEGRQRKRPTTRALLAHEREERRERERTLMQEETLL